jgi:hypothetical protein
MAEPVRQVDIRTSWREVSRTPGHVTFGVWVNGGKAGDLCVRLEEEVAIKMRLEAAFGPERAL